MFIKLETKIWSDYYFSFMKLIVTTFLVYKVKKVSTEIRKVIIRTCSSRGASMPKPWGDDAQAVGTQCPRLGQTLLCSFLYLVVST